jgi:hypothetical protein
MPNTDNLKPFKKGKSGNPEGRPPIVKELRAFLQDKLSEPDPQKAGQTNLEVLAERLFQMGQKGNLKAIELLFSHAFGRPKEIGGERSEGSEGITVKLISGPTPPDDI